MAEILWVTDSGTIATAEETLYDHLNPKHNITLHDSSSAAPGSYETTYDMVLISGVLASPTTNPGSTYYSSSIPVLVLDGEVAEQMELGSGNTANTLGDGTDQYHMYNITGPAEHTVASVRSWTDNSYIQIVDTGAGANPSVEGMVKGNVSGEQILCRVAQGSQQFLIDYPTGTTLDDSSTTAGKRFFWGLVDTMQYMNAEALATVDAIIIDYWGFSETEPVSGDYGKIIDFANRQVVRVRS